MTCALHTRAAGLWSSPGSSSATKTGHEFSALLSVPADSLCCALPQNRPEAEEEPLSGRQQLLPGVFQEL